MSNNPGKIRITVEELESEHVSDLINRQLSLRGEGGVTRSHGRWYYQNWFIFAIVGMLGALAGWAIIEPYFDDMPYIQGPISELNIEESMDRRVPVGPDAYMELLPATGYVVVNGHKVWLLDGCRSMASDGATAPLNRNQLQVGQTVGLYLASDTIALDRPVAFHVVPYPADPPSAKAQLSPQSQLRRTKVSGWLLFGTVAGLVGLMIGAADGVVCRLARRAVLGGLIGLVFGFALGILTNFVANIIYAPLSTFAARDAGDGPGGLTTMGFLIQTGGRGLAWAMAGVAMGVGQGIYLRSGRLIIYGLLGGIIGGLLGGLLFDPIDFLILGVDKPDASVSRLVGLLAIGLCVGGMIGLVELLARDAWLRMVQGPLAGKEFLIFKDVMNVGSSPRSQIYLFSDDAVVATHARIRTVGDNYEIEPADQAFPVYVNNRPVNNCVRLRQNDQIAIGRTVFVFQKRRG